MNKLIELYNQKSNYEINDFIQQIPIEINFDILRREVFDIIINNNYGTGIVSLRLPNGETNWIDQKEKLETGSCLPFSLDGEGLVPENKRPNKDYVNWHPDSGAYLKSITTSLEELTGLSIGRIRLAWLEADKGYPIHTDNDPMRIHIPLFTNNLSYILHDNEIYNFKYGNVYHLITPSIHTAWNFGRLPRLHLVLSTTGNQKITDIINNERTLIQANNNVRNQFKDGGIDSYSMSQLCKIIEAKPNSKKFEYIKKINSIIKGE